MTRTDPHIAHEPEPAAPQALRDDLNALFRAEASVPAEVDQLVMSMARQHFARRIRPRRALRWIAAGTAAAAVLLVALFLTTHHAPQHVTPGEPTLTSAERAEDIDQNGRVDILDAFALARHIQTQDASKTQWDINGDGIVDRHDVDRIAMAAVALERGTLR